MYKLTARFALLISLLAPFSAHAFDTAHVTGQPYVPNEVKSFVYYWFSLFDRNAPEARFLELIQDQGLDLRLPGAAMASHADFHKWYAGILRDIKVARHDLKRLDVFADTGTSYRVDLLVQWTAEATDGSHPSLLVHQTWKLEDRGGATPVITQIVGEAVD